jgi:hypothetical protein
MLARAIQGNNGVHTRQMGERLHGGGYMTDQESLRGVQHWAVDDFAWTVSHIVEFESQLVAIEA